jgi:Bacterial Ig-like domain (group 3)
VNKGPVSAYGASASGGYVIPLSFSLRTLAQNYSITTLDPADPTEYTLDVQCVPLFGTSDDLDFSADLWFTSETAWTTVNPSTPVTATTTALTANPASPTTVGGSVGLTAQVTPAAAGSVQFFDGATSLGTQTVSGGAASLSTTALGIGTHPITAVFTPADPTTFGGSTSSVLSYVVNPAAATTTSTALLVSPGSSAEQFSEVALTATVSPGTATGSVRFLDGSTLLGTGTLTAGSATFDISTLALGAHSFTAVYVPTDPTVYLGSTSAAAPFQITAFTGSSATETLTTTVAPGSLVISVPNDQVALPTPLLNSDGSLFTTSGQLQPITVTDNRAGNPGWTLSGVVTNFSDGTTQISAQNLGWDPALVDEDTGQSITLGAEVDAANGVAASDTGTLGLSQPRTLASAAAGSGLGTAHLGAALTLNVPTTTTAGTYTATLTLTAI